MKKSRTLAILLIAGFTLFGRAGCGSGSAGRGTLTDEQVLEAFGVSYSFTEAQINATDEVTFTITANDDAYTITAEAPTPSS